MRANVICNERYNVDFGVAETARTASRQEQMISTGASTTRNSRHLIRKGESRCHAVDLTPYVEGSYSDKFEYYQRVAASMFQAAIELGIQIEWGGLWVSLRDAPHFQLSWRQYP